MAENFASDWTSPPGDTIADALEERGWTQAELASRLDFSRKHVNDLVSGRATVNPETASRLATVLGSNTAFWLRREAQYRAALEARRERAEHLRDGMWLDELPTRDMVRLGWIAKASDVPSTVEACLRFFNVASVAAWRQRYAAPLATFRAAKERPMATGATAAWLRRGEREAEALRCAPFDAAGFKGALREFRQLTRQTEPTAFVPALIRSAAAHGVAIVFAQTPKGCPASGATLWLSPSLALILVSLRYRSNDQLWFTLFHEAGHILLHGKKTRVVEGLGVPDEEAERQADRFAADLLITPSQMQRLRNQSGPWSAAKVETLATEFGIAPGIVVGRLQREGMLPWTHLNGLKIRYDWKTW